MRPVPTRILLLLLFFSSLVTAANFTQCLEDFRNDPNRTGGVDFRGQPTNPANAVGLTYTACTALCGSDAESFSWEEFMRSFSSWLLPWLALVSQLPLGSGNRKDDLVSVVISVGSPALAAYSLMLTALNARLVYRRAQRIEHGSKGAVARALVSLQQVPLGLTRDERLLAFMSTGDQWRQEILDRLNRRHAWSITTSSFVGWVAVIFIFNLVDSFVSLDGSTDDASEGHAASTLWLWLLCLVIGWSWVPTFTCGELRSAIGLANQKAAGKAAKWIKKGANRVVSDTRAGITRLPRRMTVLKGPRKDVTDPVPEVDKEYEKVKIESNQGDTRPAGQGARPKSDSFSNPSHNPSAVSFQLSPESHHGYDWHSASADPVRTQSIVSVARSAAGYSIAQSSIRPDRDRLLISKDPSHSLNRDEFRLAATFNYSRVMGYLTLVDDVVSALNKLAHGKEEKRPISEYPTFQPITVFPPGVFPSMFKATILALVLQCGTAAAATIIVALTPRVGLGCRSLGYIVYAGVSVLILFLTIISTIFARIAETRGESPPIVRRVTGFTVRILHRTCLLLAFVNTAGLILISCFQFSHFLDNCYCNASVIGRGVESYMIIVYEGSTTAMRNSRIAAVVISAGSVIMYMGSLWLSSTLPGNIDDL